VIGAALSAAYLLRMYRNVALGPLTNTRLANIVDINGRELLAIVPLAVFIFWIGLYPLPFLEVMHMSVEHLLQQASQQIGQQPQF
jgi:NADH-quinone oxidoreductase subunit M